MSLRSAGLRIGDVEGGNRLTGMRVYDQKRKGPAFNVLEQLLDKDSTIVRSHDHAWKV